MPHLRLSLLPPDSSPDDECVIDVEASAGTTWAALREALAPWNLPADVQADGQPLVAENVVGDPPLLDGARLAAAQEPVARTDEDVLTLVSVSGPRQTVRWPLTSGMHLLGRGHELLGNDPLVSVRHATIQVHHGEVRLTDLASTDGTTLDGRRVPTDAPTPWLVGEHVRIGGSVLRLDGPPGERQAGAPDHAGHLRRTLVERRADAAAETLDWPREAPPTASARMRWVALLVPIPLAAALAFWLRTPALMAFMVLGPVAMLATSWDDRRRGRVHGRQARADLERSRHEVQLRINQALDLERHHRRLTMPPPDVVEAVVAGRHPQPRPAHGQPHRIRLGYGASTSSHRLRDGPEVRPVSLTEAPVGIDLRPGCTHVLTTSDDLTTLALEVIVAGLSTLGTPEGADVRIVTPLLEQPRWCWVGGGRFRTDATMLDDAADPVLPPAGPSGSLHELVIVDARTPGSGDRVRHLGLTTTCVVWVGQQAPPVPAQEIVLERGCDASRLPDGSRFTMDTPPRRWFPEITRLARRWNVTQARQRDAAVALPPQVTPPELFPAHGPIEWAHRPCTAIPLGIGEDGRPYLLDLSVSGPHALVAGTTGSGKSELLLGYLYGLFRLNSPQQVTALLIDYKGGATFGALTRAPHVVAVVSDLDEGLGARALTGLRAEITRRERLLAAHRHASFEAAQAAGSQVEMSRLFVIVDEFRVLAEELPDFVGGLVRLAAVGRSLGIHLVLATQRPGGIVTADMRANLDARVALRVRERADSIDVVGTPGAAELPRDRPGRAVVVVGGEKPTTVQTVFVSAPASADRPDRVRLRVLTGTDRRQERTDALNKLPEPGPSFIETLVDAAHEAATHLPQPHRPLMPPLPARVTPDVGNRLLFPTADVAWEQLGDLVPQPSSEPDHEPVAWADLPQAQLWATVGFPARGHVGISGAARSGRSTAARRFAHVASKHGLRVRWVGNRPPEPTASDVSSVSPEDAHEVSGLLEWMSRPQAATLLVIDEWEVLAQTLATLNRGMGTEDMLATMRGAEKHGIRLVVTGGRAVLSSRLGPLLDLRIMLHQNDPSEYSLAGLRPHQVPRRMPPGRGLVLPHGHQIQFCLSETSPELWQP